MLHNYTPNSVKKSNITNALSVRILEQLHRILWENDMVEMNVEIPFHELEKSSL